MTNDNAVYVDLNTLDSWKSRLEMINRDCIQILNNFSTHSKEIDSGWQSNSADAYTRGVTTLYDKAIECHNKMINVENFLQNVIDTTQSE